MSSYGFFPGPIGFFQVSTTAVNGYGSVFQDAVFEGKTDFVRLLLEYGWGLGCPFFFFSKNIGYSFCRVDAKAATYQREETPIQIALERENTEMLVLLCEATGEEVPDKIKLDQLSKAMYKGDKEEAKNEFTEILASVSPDVVSF